MNQFNINVVDGDVEKKFQALLERIMDFVPHGSSVQSTITQRDGLYSGSLKILSAGQGFFAKALSKSPHEAMVNLVDQIHDQIQQWHKTRFN